MLFGVTTNLLSGIASGILGGGAEGDFSPLYLDFTGGVYRNPDAASFDDIVTLTRSTTGTYVDESGVIQTAAIDEERFDYSSGTKGLLIEKSVTNQLVESEDFSAGWTVTGATIDTDQIEAPDSATTADFFKPNNSGSNFNFLFYNSATTAGLKYTQSIFAKAGGYGYLQFAASTGFTSSYQNFDLANGVVAGGDIVGDAHIEDFGNGWYRCSVTLEATATNSSSRILFNARGDDGARLAAFASDGVSGVYVWGAQLEQSDVPTSYIPTGGSQVTRAADVLTISPVAMAGNILKEGSEVISNGDFEDGSADWGVIGTAVADFSGGQAVVTTNNSNEGIFQAASITADAHIMTVNIVSSDTAITFIGKTGGDGLSGGTTFSRQFGSGDTGVKSFLITPSGEANSLGVRTNPAGSFVIDDVSIKPLSMPSAIGSEGSELVTDTSWVLGAGWTNTDGDLSHVSGSASRCRKLLSLNPNSDYAISFKVSGHVSGTVTPDLRINNDTSIISGTSVSSNGDYQQIITSDASVNSVAFSCSSDFVGTVENISVKEAFISSAVSIAMKGAVSYADNGQTTDARFYLWSHDADNQINVRLRTSGTRTGEIVYTTEESANVFNVESPTGALSPDTLVDYHIASRHPSDALNGALDGASYTEDSTVTGLPNLSAANFEIASDYNGVIYSLKLWDEDIGDSGIEEETA